MPLIRMNEILYQELVIWISNKQDVVSRPTAEAKYGLIVHITFEMIWLPFLLLKCGFPIGTSMIIHSYNHTIIYNQQSKIS